MNTNVSMVVIDGGPCGGKTTGIVKLSEALIGAGMIPLVVPEVATLLICGGLKPKDFSQTEFQEAVAFLQLANESAWYESAVKLSNKTGKRIVILCDRGFASGIAYIDDLHPFELFEAVVLGDTKFSSLEAIFARYTGVIHFVTAADGAEDYYTIDNNRARTETLEEARILDSKTKAVWLAHSHLNEIANVTPSGVKISFEQKMHNATVALFHMLGVPEPIEIEDKYLLKSFDPSALPVPHEEIIITQTYLVSRETGASERVRKRLWRDGVSYIHTVKRDCRDGGRYEVEKFISHHEYKTMLGRADMKRRPLYKTRYCFLWNAQYFEIDVFKNISGLVLLEREKTSISEETIIPPFIDVDRDVAGDPAYSNSELAII
jgi:CYTH domain-containing protein